MIFKLVQENDAIETHFTVEIQWLENLWDYENMFETGEVWATEC